MRSPFDETASHILPLILCLYHAYLGSITDIEHSLLIRKYWLVGWLVLYSISTLVGYLIPNSVYTYILNILNKR